MIAIIIKLKPRPKRAEAGAKREIVADAEVEASSRARVGGGERRGERGREKRGKLAERPREQAERGREIETQRKRVAHTRAMKAKCCSSCCALSDIRERSTNAVAIHLESGLPVHANERRKKRTSSASSAWRNTCEMLHKTRACVITPATYPPPVYEMRSNRWGGRKRN